MFMVIMALNSDSAIIGNYSKRVKLHFGCHFPVTSTSLFFSPIKKPERLLYLLLKKEFCIFFSIEDFPVPLLSS